MRLGPVLVSAALACAGAARAEVAALDSEGRHVALARPAQRIASLAPHITELLFAAGAGERVVAVSAHSDFPQAATRLPVVASAAGIDLERLLALRVDLAVAWRLAATQATLERLPALGVPVFFSEPRRLADIPEAIERLGTLAGTRAVADARAAALRAELHALRQRYAGRPVVRVFYQISDRPLMTVSGRQFISDALALCGARNVFADAPVIAPVVSAEEVVALDPDVIVAARERPDDRGWESAWRRFAGLRAVRAGTFVTIAATEMHRHGPRAVPATARLCAELDRARGALEQVRAASPR